MSLKLSFSLIAIILILGCTQGSDFVEKNAPAATGCCTPACVPSAQNECVQAGGQFTNSPCSAVEECKISCCEPFCTESTKVYCEQAGGISTGISSCSDVDECEEGCCSPFCVQTTKSVCGEEHGYGGDWTEGSCDSVDECNNVCCSPSNTIMTKTECEQMGGVEVSESLCAGTGTITIEMPHILSCICNDGTNPKDICTESMNLVQSFTASFSPDPNAPDDSFINSWLYNQKNYYFIGTGTFAVTGNRENYRLSEYTATCYGPGVPPGTQGIVLTEDKSIFEYEVSNTANVTAQVTKRDDGTYAISFSTPSTMGTEREIWTRTVTSGCSSESPSSESETYEDEFEGIIIGTSLDNVTTLNGYITFTQYPPEDAFACEGINNSATGIIRWSFTLPE